MTVKEGRKQLETVARATYDLILVIVLLYSGWFIFEFVTTSYHEYFGATAYALAGIKIFELAYKFHKK